MSLQSRFVRRRVNILPKVGEIFSGAITGGSNYGPGDGFLGDPEDPHDPGIPGQLQGIQTESGINIETESGFIIQAENQA